MPDSRCAEGGFPGKGRKSTPDALGLLHMEYRVSGLFEGDALDQGEAPGEFLSVKVERVVAIVAGCDGEADDSRGSDVVAPGHVDPGDEDPSRGRVVQLLEPDRPDDCAGVEDGRDADLTGEIPVLHDGCHAGIMGEPAPGCKGDRSFTPLDNPRARATLYLACFRKGQPGKIQGHKADGPVI